MPSQNRQTLFPLYILVHFLLCPSALFSVTCLQHFPFHLPTALGIWSFSSLFFRLLGHHGNACTAGSPKSRSKTRAQWERFPRQSGGNTGKEAGRGTGKRGRQIHDCSSSPAAAEHCGETEDYTNYYLGVGQQRGKEARILHNS